LIDSVDKADKKYADRHRHTDTPVSDVVCIRVCRRGIQMQLSPKESERCCYYQDKSRNSVKIVLIELKDFLTGIVTTVRTSHSLGIILTHRL
jgi:hypothetical protein